MNEKPKPIRIARAVDEFNHAVDNYIALHEQLLVDGQFPESAYEPLQNAMRRVHEAWGLIAHIMITHEFTNLADSIVRPVPLMLRQQDIDHDVLTKLKKLELPPDDQ
jgi:hypothetical protein